jgi:hypothetical protein
MLVEGTTIEVSTKYKNKCACEGGASDIFIASGKSSHCEVLASMSVKTIATDLPAFSEVLERLFGES